MISALFSSFCLLAVEPAQLPAPTPMEVVRQHHLETAEGRLAFLTQELAPYALAAEALNQQITETASYIETLSPDNDGNEILSQSQYVTQCMDVMTWMLPSLELAQRVEADLAQMDSICNSPESLTQEQQEAVERLATLCLYIDNYNQEE
jgi:hypothetical protein